MFILTGTNTSGINAPIHYPLYEQRRNIMGEGDPIGLPLDLFDYL